MKDVTTFYVVHVHIWGGHKRYTVGRKLEGSDFKIKT